MPAGVEGGGRTRAEALQNLLQSPRKLWSPQKVPSACRRVAINLHTVPFQLPPGPITARLVTKFS